jgi:hypothetical protein
LRGRGADQALRGAIVSDGASGGVDAAAQGRFRDDPPVPDGLQHIVAADDAIPIADQELKEIENLRLQLDTTSLAVQLAGFAIEPVAPKNVDHAVPPPRAMSCPSD